MRPMSGFTFSLGRTRRYAPPLTGLNRSRETGRMIATERITLVQEREEQFGFLVFAPVYRKGGEGAQP